LVWAVLATEAHRRRRTWVGLAAFAALEVATFVRYTNVVILACAVLASCVAWRRVPRLPLGTLCWWLGSVAIFGAGIAVFDDRVYGGPLKTGYQPGEVTFSLGAIGPNLRLMPAHLMQAMPFLVLALIALGWITARRMVTDRDEVEDARRDMGVAAALAASWLAIWGLYSTYTWTNDPTNGSVGDVRFYVPALSAIALLGAWLVTRLPRSPSLRSLVTVTVIAVLFGLGIWAYYAMYGAIGVPLHR
jgi:hypothetical protein